MREGAGGISGISMVEGRHQKMELGLAFRRFTWFLEGKRHITEN